MSDKCYYCDCSSPKWMDPGPVGSSVRIIERDSGDLWTGNLLWFCSIPCYHRYARKGDLEERNDERREKGQMRKILVNDMLREFIDPKEFFVQMYDENMKAGKTECFGLRQTGRTTRLIIETIQKVVENQGARFTILTYNWDGASRIGRLIDHYKHQLDVQIPEDSIRVVPDGDFSFIKAEGTIVLCDNSIMDFKAQKELREKS